MRARWSQATLFAAVATLALAVPVQAKFPPFSVELDPARPVAGRPFTVTVRLWDDPAHTGPFSGGPNFETVDDLLAFVPEDGVGDERRQVRVILESIGPGVLRAEVMLREPGIWTLVPFPRSSSDPAQVAAGGYPRPLAIEVRDRSSAAPAMVAGAVVIPLGGAAIAAICLRLRLPVRLAAARSGDRAAADGERFVE